MKIRKFIEKDAKEASELLKRTLIEVNSKDYPDSVIQFLCNSYPPERMIEFSNERVFIVAEEEGKIIGTATLLDDYIGTVFVDALSQKKGVGTKLMQTVEKIAKEKNIKKIILPASITAIGFYEKLGYKKGEMRDDGDYGITYTMKKEL